MTTLTNSVQSTDAGLRSFMIGVYNWMTAGLLVTAAVAFTLFQTGLAAIIASNVILMLLVAFSPIALIFVRYFIPQTAFAQGATFLMLAAMMGASMSSIFLAYSLGNIAVAFLATSAGFAGLSLWGYTTKTDMSGLGSFFIMALFGLLAVMVLNWFLASTVLATAISAFGVLLFSGLTAYDTQTIKSRYISRNGTPVAAIDGALSLYLDFINLFMFILQLLGGNRD